MAQNSKLSPPGERMCFALYSGAKAIVARYRPYLDQLNMTYSQYLVYLILFPVDEMPINHLGVELALDSGTLTPLLKRMEKNDLVTRTRSEEDERKVLISLTPKARLLQDQISDMQYQVQCATGLDPEELIDLRGRVNELTNTLRNNGKTDDQ